MGKLDSPVHMGLSTDLYLFVMTHNYWICGVEYTNDFHMIHYQMLIIKYVYLESTEIYLDAKKKHKVVIKYYPYVTL